MDRLYSSAPDGYCGDEDNGQTSAWYVFSALGFYPVCPGSGEYAVGAPLFKNALINLENGKKVRITAADSYGNDVLFLKHEDLIKGTRLQLKTK
jgi:putative alpha-1,2-mannosidase